MTPEADAMPSAGAPRVIVVAERPLSDLLASNGIDWSVQERQPTVAAMWDALSGGRLDQQSRILVFSDSLADGTSSADSELGQTARAIVAMANAGAFVFVAAWRPDALPHLQRLIAEAATAQGVDAQALGYHVLPVQQGGRAVLDTIRRVVADEVDFPDQYPETADGALSREAFTPSAVWQPPGAAAGQPSRRPGLPPIGGLPTRAEDVAADRPSDVPAAASLELLARPKVPGQVTITVTSSKGGSGKSTASILLAGSIARASQDAGRPLSVCLIDLDTRDGQVASLIGKFMPTALNIRVQPVWDEERIRRNLVHAPGLGIDTLLAPIRPRTADTVGPDFYRTIIRSLQRMYDVVVMDTSVQYLDPLIAQVALPEAEEILFVTTLASTAVQGMARALREITAPVDESGLGISREKIGILVNQSVANVGMERDQVLAAGLGVPVVGVIPLATKDVLTATNLNRMHSLLDHPLIGPAYNELARACLPQRTLAPWRAHDAGQGSSSGPASSAEAGNPDEGARRRGLFRR
ncbi:MAG: AAA family ATPase [Candidatus Nanopelagicales bacterium]